MAKNVIPIAPHQQHTSEVVAARNLRSALVGVTLVLLHLASIALALTYF